MKVFKYFLEFISILSLFAIFKILGLRNASNLGGVLGRFIGPLFRAKKGNSTKYLKDEESLDSFLIQEGTKDLVYYKYCIRELF